MTEKNNEVKTLDWKKVIQRANDDNSISTIVLLNSMLPDKNFEKQAELLLEKRLNEADKYVWRNWMTNLVSWNLEETFDFLKEFKKIVYALSQRGRKLLFMQYFMHKIFLEGDDFEKSSNEKLIEISQIVKWMKAFNDRIHTVSSRLFDMIYRSKDPLKFKETMSQLRTVVNAFPKMFESSYFITKEFERENHFGQGYRYELLGPDWSREFEENFLFDYGFPSNLMRIADKSVFQQKKYIVHDRILLDSPIVYKGQFYVNLAFSFRNKWLDPNETLTYFEPYETLNNINYQDERLCILTFLPVQKNNNELLDALEQEYSSTKLEFSFILLQYNSHLQKRKLEKEGKTVTNDLILKYHNFVKTRIETDFAKNQSNNHIFDEEQDPFTISQMLYYIENIYNVATSEKKISDEETLIKFAYSRLSLQPTYEVAPQISSLITSENLSQLSKKLILQLLNHSNHFLFVGGVENWNLNYIYLDCGGSILTKHDNVSLYNDPFLSVLHILAHNFNWKDLTPIQKHNFLLYMDYQLDQFKFQTILVEQLGYDIPQVIQMYLFAQSQSSQNSKELYKSMIFYFDNDKEHDKISSLTKGEVKHQQASTCLYQNYKYSPEKLNLPELRKSHELYCHTDPTFIPSRSQVFLTGYLKDWIKEKEIKEEKKEKEENHILTFIQKEKVFKLYDIIKDWNNNPNNRSQILKEWQEMMKLIQKPKSRIEYLLLDAIAFVEFIFMSLLEKKQNNDEKTKVDKCGGTKRERESDESDKNKEKDVSSFKRRK
jgi:hypothetical protein